MQQTETAQTNKKQGNKPIGNLLHGHVGTLSNSPVPELEHTSLPAMQSAIKNCSKSDVADAMFEIVSADNRFKSLQLSQLKLTKEYLELTEKISKIEIVGIENLDRAAKSTYEKDKLRQNSISTEININKKELLKFNKEYLSGNPISVDTANGITVSLSVVTARADFSALLTSFTELARTKEINQALNEFQNSNSSKLTDTQRSNFIKLLDDYINKNEHLFRTNNAYNSVKEAYEYSKNDDVIQLANNYFSPLKHTAAFTKYAKEAGPLFDRIASAPTEDLEKIGIMVKRNSGIYDQDINSLLTKLDDSPNQLSVSEKNLAEAVKKKLWDTEKGWMQAAVGESDITAVITSYAILKRLSELVSSTETKLEEISNNNLDTVGKSVERKKVIDTFWKVYFDTSKFVTGELNKEITRYLGSQTSIDTLYLSVLKDSREGNPSALMTLKALQAAIERKDLRVSSQTIKTAKIISDPAHALHSEYMQQTTSDVTTDTQKEYLYTLSKPYHGLTQALEVIENNITMTYTPYMYGNHTAVMEHTLHNINPAFNQIIGYLEKASLSPEKIDNVLSTFKSANTGHPEREKIEKFTKDFKTRFSRVFSE